VLFSIQSNSYRLSTSAPDAGFPIRARKAFDSVVGEGSIDGGRIFRIALHPSFHLLFISTGVDIICMWT
jgi:hypothetical protein